MSSVLSGDRIYSFPRPTFARLVYVWLPVAVMLGVIARESTEGFSGLHTSVWLRPIWQGIFGAVSDDRWLVLHHRLRKTGHFLGYGTLAVTWLRAWLLTWMSRFRLRAAGAWRGWAFAMAIWCTAAVASVDELHQTWLPDRTGVVPDVLLDTTGGLVFCCLVALLWFRAQVREAAFATEGNASVAQTHRKSATA